MNHHHDVPFKTLEKQYTFDKGKTVIDDCGDGVHTVSTENKIIHGDNLEALKALLPEYEGRIKCIYIDPPYNTGNEGWVYNDNVNSPRIQKWLGQVVGKEAEDLSRHDKWLCMMYPRLTLLHQLLADDGVIFISIDDNEQANLKLLCDEIFGAGNFVTNLIWQKKKGGSNDSKYVAVEHEYIIMYGKNLSSLEKMYINYEGTYSSRYNEEDEKGRFFWDTFRRKSGKQYYPITCPDGSVLENDEKGEPISWLRSEQRFLSDLNEGEVRIVKINGKWSVHFKQRMPLGYKPRSIITEYGTTSEGSEDLKAIFNKTGVFSNPKPFPLISYLLKFINDKSSIILDSFAGSGTTAHAVLNLNKQDGGNRKFILVEMEDYAETITAERVKRVINGYGEGKNAVEGTGGSFSYYELGEPIMNGDYINENQPVEKIKEYIWYSETHSKYEGREGSYFLGNHNGAGYYFYYEKNSITTLSYDTLNIVEERAEQYIIYADQCLIDKDDLLAKNIIFKKIPRDIRKF